MNIIAVIPARGGSKGIPRKNVRLMNGKPLIAYAIGNALACDAIGDVVVSSDDSEILSIAAKYGATPLERSSSLAQDAVTLDPVIFDAVEQMEKRNGKKYDVVITLQPTSPLLSVETLSAAIESFLKGEKDTYISATNKPHLAWTKNEQGENIPLYKERLNRQQLPPNYLEAGAFFITKREFVSPNSRMGKAISVYEIPENEATDIDDISDWITCESRLKAQTIVFRCDGHRKLGMGRINRCINLAYRLIGHNVIFITREDWADGTNAVRDRFFKSYTIKDDEDFFRLLADIKPDVVVNDCSDSTKDYMLALKANAKRVVTFEDMGDGAAFADATINAMEGEENSRKGKYCGERFIDLRDEFLIEDAISIKAEVKNVLVMFGGTDPSKLTKRIYSLAKERSSIGFSFVVDPAFDCPYHGIEETDNIKIYQNITRITDVMRNADIAFSSQGRTAFELACLGIPTIVLAQNAREQAHSFAQMHNGFINLGLGKDVSDETIEKTFDWLCSAYEIRKNLSALMQKHDLRRGTDRVKKIILGENL